MSKSFILLQLRPEDDASAGEYESFLKFSGLPKVHLNNLRIQTGEAKAINLDDYSGVILGGGPYNVSDPDSKKSAAQKKCEAWLNNLMDQIIKQDFPFLASCSIGLFVKNQGGKVSRKYGEYVGGHNVALTAEGKKDKLLKNVDSNFLAYAGHKEGIEELPKNVVCLAKTATCPTHMYRIKSNIYGCQFHPELDGPALAARIQVYKHYGYFPPEDADKLSAKVLKQKVTEPEKILRNFIDTYKN